MLLDIDLLIGTETDCSSQSVAGNIGPWDYTHYVRISKGDEIVEVTGRIQSLFSDNYLHLVIISTIENN